MTEPAVFSDADQTLQLFAKHMAMEIEPFEKICRNVGITEAKGREYQELIAYKNYYDAARIVWTSTENKPEKLKRLFQEVTEFCLPHVVTLFHDPETSDNAKANILGHLIKGSGVGERAAAAGGVAGETVKIVINLGNDQRVEFDKPKPIIEATAEAVYD
jgi:hypothetical protein